jgi:two-component system sensor histidine kinase AgrC
MNIKKTVKALLIINGLQFIAAILLWLVIGTHVLGRVNPAVYLTIGILLLSSLLTLLGLYAASRYQDDSYRESMKNLENLNLKLRAQRHDYLNHLQVIYGLLQLGEYEDAREYMEPVFRDISRVTKAMKTSQPAVNALLQAKMESAEKNGIDMVVEVGTPLKEIPLEPWELCKILANLIDNAITALGEREKDRKLTVEIRQENFPHTQQWAGHPCGQAAAHFPPGLFHEKRGGARHRPHHCFGNRKGYQGHHQPDLR